MSNPQRLRHASTVSEAARVLAAGAGDGGARIKVQREVAREHE